MSGAQVARGQFADETKPLDIIVVGANGLVGSWVCHLLHEMSSGTSPLLLAGEAAPRWGIAGRSADKLQPLLEKYGDRPCFITDEHAPESFDSICAATHIVVAAAGPYRQKGPRELLAAVSRHERLTYFDLTGEHTLVADVARLHHADCLRRCSAIVQMCGPQETVLPEIGARLAAQRLRETHGVGTACVLNLTRQEAGGISGGSVESGTRMKMEEPEERVKDPFALLPNKTGEAVEERSDVKSCSLPSRWVEDNLEVEQYKPTGVAHGGGSAEVWISPSFLGAGNVRMWRRANALLVRGAQTTAGEQGVQPPTPYTAEGKGDILGCREAMYHTDKMGAMMAQFGAKAAPSQTLKAVQAGRLPKVGTGPTTQTSKQTSFCDFVVAFDSASPGAHAAYCRVRAKPWQGHGIACGYAGAAYTQLACAMAALCNGGVAPSRCGAGLSPSVALEGTDLLQRLRQCGYEFDVFDGEPSPQELMSTAQLLKSASSGAAVNWPPAHASQSA